MEKGVVVECSQMLKGAGFLFFPLSLQPFVSFPTLLFLIPFILLSPVAQAQGSY